MKILWVEDNERFVRLAGAQFLANHEIFCAPSLAHARAALESDNDFDLVLLDYDLPDGKGDMLLPELLATRTSAGTRLRAIGTSSHDAGNAALLAAGADAVCSKMHFNRLPVLLASLGFE